MRSIHAKILFWLLGTLVVSLIGFGVTTWVLTASHPPPLDLLHKLQRFQLEGGREAYEKGGQEALAAYMQRLDRIFETEHYLVDESGRDMVDGTDRSELVESAARPPFFPPLNSGPVAMATPPAPGPRLVVALRPRFRPGNFLPYYLWILPVVAGLGYALSLHLARPLRGLRHAVERFGRGELATRINSTRRDELGEVARAFDQMAERIETLMVAERRLLQDVSHELRSPLARLALAVRLARTSDDPDAAFKRIHREVDRLSALVDELLQLTTAEGDPQSRTEEPVRLAELLEDLVNDCSLEADGKGCRLELQTDSDVVVTGDRRLLHRAGENVLRNAIRHAPESTAVEVGLSRANGHATIAIRDHGPGVPDAALQSIFDPFFRVDTDRSRSSGGVGLGLAITRRAVSLHGGEVSASNAHPGLLVTITLPTA